MFQEKKIDKITELGIKIEQENMDDKIYSQLCDPLYECKDIFATSLADLTGSIIIEADINTTPSSISSQSLPTE